MSLFYFSDPIYLPVRDVNSAAAWYIEKLGCRKQKSHDDAEPGEIVLAYSDDTESEVLELVPMEAGETASEYPIIFTTDATKARNFLSSHGANVGPIQTDEQGTRYFEMRDVEGNAIEISEEP
jgi:catechol 2,3-dioxygenase-like lactoylglutathione lyase family enzyme